MIPTAVLEDLIRTWTAQGVRTSDPTFALCAQQLRFTLDEQARATWNPHTLTYRPAS